MPDHLLPQEGIKSRKIGRNASRVDLCGHANNHRKEWRGDELRLTVSLYSVGIPVQGERDSGMKVNAAHFKQRAKE
jgi:hypothetical protein